MHAHLYAYRNNRPTKGNGRKAAYPTHPPQSYAARPPRARQCASWGGGHGGARAQPSAPLYWPPPHFRFGFSYPSVTGHVEGRQVTARPKKTAAMRPAHPPTPQRVAATAMALGVRSGVVRSCEVVSYARQGSRLSLPLACLRVQARSAVHRYLHVQGFCNGHRSHNAPDGTA